MTAFSSGFSFLFSSDTLLTKCRRATIHCNFFRFFSVLKWFIKTAIEWVNVNPSWRFSKILIGFADVLYLSISRLSTMVSTECGETCLSTWDEQELMQIIGPFSAPKNWLSILDFRVKAARPSHISWEFLSQTLAVTLLNLLRACTTCWISILQRYHQFGQKYWNSGGKICILYNAHARL